MVVREIVLVFAIMVVMLIVMDVPEVVMEVVMEVALEVALEVAQAVRVVAADAEEDVRGLDVIAALGLILGVKRGDNYVE